MRKSQISAVSTAALLSVLATGCGGGGESPVVDVAPPAQSVGSLQVPAAAGVRSGTAPAANAAPTYAMQNTAGEATQALAEVLGGYKEAPATADGGDFRGPAGAQWATLAAALGLSTSLNCATSGSITVSSSGAGLVSGLAGSSLKLVYNACNIAGVVTNGEFNMVFSRYTGINDFAYTSSWNNLTITQAGQATKTLSGTQSCTNANGAVSCNYSDTTGRSWASGTVMANALLTGRYATNFPGGVVTVNYSNFGAVGGTAQVLGVNGSKAVVTRNSATKFTVVVTVGGLSSNYVFGA